VTPYYDQGGVTIYCGDARDIVPQLSGWDTYTCDPPYGTGWYENDKDVTAFVAGLAASQKQPGISEEDRRILNKEEMDRAKDRDDVVRTYLKHARHKKQWPPGLVDDDDK